MSNVNAESGFVDQKTTETPDDLNTFMPSYGNREDAELPKGADKYEREDGAYIDTPTETAGRSLFNKYQLFRHKGISGENYPLTDTDSASRRDIYENRTGRQLVENPKGASIYIPEDFLWVDKYNVLPFDRMITMRRFAYPVFDDIFGSIQTEPDVGRLVGFSDQDTNKLSDIMSFSFGMRFKELKSATEQARMEGDQNGVDGYMKSVLKYVDPKFGQEAMLGKNALNYDPLHDSNKVYGPVDSISETHIRDVGMDFNHELELKFEYTLKSKGGVNPRAAFVDILSNVFAVCTNNAKFWGGARYWVGPRPTKYLNDLKFLSATNFDQFMNKSQVSFKSMLGNFGGDGASAKDTLKNVATNAANLGLGKLLDKVGRPGIPVMNSLLTGTPIGEWHITIGDPMNPTMVMGNMILTNTQIAFDTDMLGNDGFPTKFSVTCSLKHAMPRGQAEIESMFNAGKGRTYLKPKEFFKSTATASTAQKPKMASTYTQKATNKLFGDFDETQILQNKDKVWDFLKTDKK